MAAVIRYSFIDAKKSKHLALWENQITVAGMVLEPMVCFLCRPARVAHGVIDGK